MAINMIRHFLRLEAAGGIVLIFAAVFALIVANSPLRSLYFSFLDIPVAIQIGALEIAKPLLLWVNDGLMAVFFFLVGLEVKREFLIGELSTPAKVALPGFAAIGGVAIPALIYVLINIGDPASLNGWAIPTATDIAFALGILALLGSRAPLALKVLLTAVAIFDDILAIVIIALFYTDNLAAEALYGALVFIAALFIINRLGVRKLAPYILLGIALWVCVLKSGVHATLAGVVTALFIPLKKHDGEEESLLEHLEHQLHPWVAFMVVPIFAFANAGVSFVNIGIYNFIEPVKLGIALGLFVGKQVGCFSFLWAAIRMGFTVKPAGVSYAQLYGVSLLCGVGFTMSLFIGSLAFEHTDFDAPIKLGVFTGTLLSGVVGFIVLFVSGSAKGETAEAASAAQEFPEVDTKRESHI